MTMLGHDTLPQSTAAVRWCWLLFGGLIAINVVLFVMGSLAALRGGDLVRWGSGPGGLDGTAELSQAAFALVLGPVAAIAIVWSGRSITSLVLAVVVFATGLLIPIAFLVGGHLVEPCDLGWLDASTKIRGAQVCVDGGITFRFHLLVHGTVGLLVAVVVVLAARRVGLFDRRPPETVRYDDAIAIADGGSELEPGMSSAQR